MVFLGDLSSGESLGFKSSTEVFSVKIILKQSSTLCERTRTKNFIFSPNPSVRRSQAFKTVYQKKPKKQKKTGRDREVVQGPRGKGKGIGSTAN